MATPALTQTTLSAAITPAQNTLKVASTTGISAPTNNFVQMLYILDPGTCRGELVTVSAVDTTNNLVTVARLQQFKQNHLSGALVIINPIDSQLGSGGFVEFDPLSVPPKTPIYTWIVNVVTGSQWLYSSVTGTWVPGFNNNQQPIAPTVAVASVAGVITPSGPLFHVTGTNAITGFTRPNGFTSGIITIIPDAVFTWTTGDGSLGVAGTAVVAKALTFTYDWIAAKWYPSYIA
jgi:hypothetical protein